MADGELSGSLSPCLHPDPRYARRARLRLAVGCADEGYGSDGLDDRTEIRDRLRKTRAEQAPVEIDDGSFRAAETQRAAAKSFLGVSDDFDMTLAWNCNSPDEVDAVLDFAVSKGASLLKPAHKTDYGGN